jgi:hypothetical protein
MTGKQPKPEARIRFMLDPVYEFPRKCLVGNSVNKRYQEIEAPVLG